MLYTWLVSLNIIRFSKSYSLTKRAHVNYTRKMFCTVHIYGVIDFCDTYRYYVICRSLRTFWSVQLFIDAIKLLCIPCSRTRTLWTWLYICYVCRCIEFSASYFRRSAHAEVLMPFRFSDIALYSVSHTKKWNI